MQPVVARGLCIRPFQKDDAPAFVAAALESLATVGVWMPWCHEKFSLADAEAWFDACRRNLDAGSSYDVGLFSAADGGLLGGVSINQLNRTHNFGNIGYWVRQTRQRQGIASRAVLSIAEFGFGKLGLTRLEIVVAEGNGPSRRVAQKAGAAFEAVARNRLVVRGTPRPAAVYSLIPSQ